MTSRRLLKAAEAIREVVATSILTDIRDPRIQDVTVVRVKVSTDMREAKVFVSVMGDEAQEKLSLRGLQNSAGFLQAKIKDRIDSRYIPRLQFEIDRGSQSALEVGELLAKIRREREEEEAAKLAAAGLADGQDPAETDAISEESVAAEPSGSDDDTLENTTNTPVDGEAGDDDKVGD
ncbi:Ribosome-binding factor A [Roseimaritima multifibrata]|uniref:Ribosome-binding factor A n=1 Tax=Roseimaritima multifibrata TaxID=1930274 RepID=A0A517MMZ7_9BACT|nr:30S ribosome-binding factor RbfA [Roseimaritima multifibrata]QDS96234.1 Ribosome-binding factor A [Roseimaritima multifibrata]